MEFGHSQDIQEKIMRLHGLNRGSKPFPCGYCYYYNIGIVPITEHKSNIVVSFRDEKDPDSDAMIKVFCDGGTKINGPDGYGHCSKFALDQRDVRTHCIDEIFSYIEKDYTMFIISKVYEYPDGILRSKIVERKDKGYHTREKRIEELERDGYLDVVGEGKDRILVLTPAGNRLARSIRTMYEGVMETVNIGDLLNYRDCRDVYETVMRNEGCSADHMTQGMDNDRKELFGRILVDLEREGYVCSKYDTRDWETLTFYTTDVGRRCYERSQQSGT